MSEPYNHEHKQPDRSRKRQFVELTASTYEYCYDNPVRFVDPSGEQAPIGLDLFVHIATWLSSSNSSHTQTGKTTVNIDPTNVGPGTMVKILAVGTTAAIKTAGDKLGNTIGGTKTGTFDIISPSKYNEKYNRPGASVRTPMSNSEISSHNSTVVANLVMLIPIPGAQEEGLAGKLTGVETGSFDMFSLKSFSTIPVVESKAAEITESAIEIIAKHLEQFGPRADNEIMLERLNKIATGEMEATGIDINFFKHEIREEELMKGGMSQSDAHYQTLQEQNMYHAGSENLLYTKEALDAGNKQWFDEFK